MARVPVRRPRGRPRATETELSLWLNRAGISRDDFAERIGVTRQHLDKLCRGARRPGLDLAVLHLLQFALLRVPVPEVLAVRALAVDIPVEWSPGE